MRTKATILAIFIFAISFGQKAFIQNAVFNFSAFDTLHGKLQTDKILFNKLNMVDTLGSRPYLDSVVWCLNRNPTIVIEVFLTKNAEWGYNYQESLLGIKQIRNLVNYLCEVKNIPPARIFPLGSNCGPVLITSGDLTNSKDKERDNKIRTNFRIISKDYRVK